MLADAWKSCQDAEVLIESPYAMAGVHIAEALGMFQARGTTFSPSDSLDRHTLFPRLHHAMDEVSCLVML